LELTEGGEAMRWRRLIDDKEGWQERACKRE
jgi:hypothetical protein